MDKQEHAMKWPHTESDEDSDNNGDQENAAISGDQGSAGTCNDDEDADEQEHAMKRLCTGSDEDGGDQENVAIGSDQGNADNMISDGQDKDRKSVV